MILLQNVRELKRLVAFLTIRRCPFSDHLRLLHIPSPKQEPARGVKKSGDKRQASRNRVSDDITRTLLTGVQLAGDKVRKIGQTVSERLADGAFRVGR